LSFSQAGARLSPDGAARLDANASLRLSRVDPRRGRDVGVGATVGRNLEDRADAAHAFFG